MLVPAQTAHTGIGRYELVVARCVAVPERGLPHSFPRLCSSLSLALSKLVDPRRWWMTKMLPCLLHHPQPVLFFVIPNTCDEIVDVERTQIDSQFLNGTQRLIHSFHDSQ
jgi:hypothetical protein